MAGWHARSVTLLLGFGLVFSHLALALRGERSRAALLAQGEPVILHAAIECWPEDEFLQLNAVFQPGAEIRTAKVYFRSDKYPDFYLIEMKVATDGKAQTTMPKPGPETAYVIYYLEAVTNLFASSRSTEWSSPVTDPDECKRRDPALAWFTGRNPNIVVQTLRAGLPAVPPGFQAAGIFGAGGGLGAGTAVLIGAGAAGGAAAVVVISGGESKTVATTSVVGEPTTTTAATTTPTTTTPTTTTGPTTTVGTTTVSTTTGPTTSVTTTVSTTTGPTTSVTTTVSTTTTPTTTIRTTTVPAEADLSVKKDGPGSAKVGETFDYRITVTNGGPQAASGVVLKDVLPAEVMFIQVNPPAPPCTTSGQTVVCNLGTLNNGAIVTVTIRVTVMQRAATAINTADVSATMPPDPNPGNNTATLLTVFTLKEAPVQTSFTSFLGIGPFDGTARANVLLNGEKLETTDNSAPARHNLRGRLGENTVEAYTTSTSGGEGFWRFDFSGADHFVAGSLKVDSGQVLSLDSHSVVFRLSGAPGERIKLRYQLLP